nr:LysR substrate-binding domain-containing protein [Sphingomonas sp. TX0522]
MAAISTGETKCELWSRPAFSSEQSPLNFVPYDTVALRYAVLAADLLSFSRAALHVGVKQATLSRRIGDLEGRLGFRLFERSNRGAVLSDAGIEFIKAARRLQADLEALIESGRAMDAGHSGRLGVGFSTSLTSGNMRALIMAIGDELPSLRVSFVEGDRARLSQALHARAIDFAVISGHVADIGLERQTLWGERLMVVLPEQHLLTQRDRIYWPDLRTEKFMLSRQDPGLDLADQVTARLGEPGWRPAVSIQELSRENVLNMVPMLRAVSLATDTSLGRPWPGVILREIYEPVGGISTIAYSGYWLRDNQRPALTAFLELLANRYPAV